MVARRRAREHLATPAARGAPGDKQHRASRTIREVLHQSRNSGSPSDIVENTTRGRRRASDSSNATPQNVSCTSRIGAPVATARATIRLPSCSSARAHAASPYDFGVSPRRYLRPRGAARHGPGRDPFPGRLQRPAPPTRRTDGGRELLREAGLSHPGGPDHRHHRAAAAATARRAHGRSRSSSPRRPTSGASTARRRLLRPRNRREQPQPHRRGLPFNASGRPVQLHVVTPAARSPPDQDVPGPPRLLQAGRVFHERRRPVRLLR